MKLKDCWQLADAVELLELAQQSQKDVDLDTLDFPLFIATSPLKELRKSHVGKLKKLIKHTIDLFPDELQEACDSQCLDVLEKYLKLVGISGFPLTCIEALRALSVVGKVRQRFVSTRVSDKILFDELIASSRSQYMKDLDRMKGNLQVLITGDREIDKSTDFTALRHETYIGLWSLSICPPSVLLPEMLSDSIVVLKRAVRQLESQWMDSFYPLVSENEVLWSYFASRNLTDLCETVEMHSTSDLVKGLRGWRETLDGNARAYSSAYLPYVNWILEVSEVNGLTESPIAMKVLVDYSLPFLRFAHLTETHIRRNYERTVTELGKVLQPLSTSTLEELKSIQALITAEHGLTTTIDIGSIMQHCFVHRQIPNGQEIAFASFREGQQELLTVVPDLLDDVWEPRGYIPFATTHRLQQLSSWYFHPPVSRNWQQDLQEVCEIFVGDYWAEWDHYVGVQANDTFEDYFVEGGKIQDVSFRALLEGRSYSSAERAAIARRVLMGGALFLKWRKNDPESYESLNRVLKYNSSAETNDDNHIRGHLHHLGLTVKSIKELLPDNPSLWPGEEAWLTTFLKTYR